MMTAWEHGYLSNKIQHGNLKLMPPPSVMVTFDDAFSNLSRNVIPIISKLNIPITIFVPTGSVGQQPSWLNDIAHSDSNEKVMSSSQLYLLKENPLVTLGSHTVSHPRLTQIHGEKLNYELCTSINYLRGITHKEISDLAFPHGDYNDNVIKMAKEAGYKKVYTLDPVVYSANDNNDTLQLIGRFSMSPDIWPIEFYLTINGAYAWLHTWRSFIKKFTTN